MWVTRSTHWSGNSCINATGQGPPTLNLCTCNGCLCVVLTWTSSKCSWPRIMRLWCNVDNEVRKKQGTSGKHPKTDTMRMVLLSNTSKEFPDNTNSAFKVRLPNPLHLEDGLWEVGLISLPMPDVGLKVDALTDNKTANLIETAQLMKIIVNQMQWLQTWKTQVSKWEFREGDGPGSVGKGTI